MLIEKLHEKFSNMPNLRTREIRVDKAIRKVFCVLSYPELINVSGLVRSEITDFVKSIVPKGYSCNVSFVDDKFTEITFRKFLSQLLKAKYPIFASIPKDKILVRIVERHVALTFNVSKVDKQNMEIANFEEQFLEFMRNYTCYTVEVDLVQDDSIASNFDFDQQETLVQLAMNRELLKPSRYFTIKNVDKYIGKRILGSPMYISDIRKPMDNCIICGRISNKSVKALKNNPTMQICKFNLSDDSDGSIPCSMFVQFQIADKDIIQQTTNKTESEVKTISERREHANDKKMKLLMNMYDTMQVVVRGKIVYSDFSQRLEMKVYDVCTCEIMPISQQPKFKRPIPQNYSLVKPELFSEYRQLGFADTFLSDSNNLQGKNLVVLHCNVTGFNKTKDKLVALCGVKIEDGHVTSRLFTYVNPEVALEDKVLQPAQITSNKLVFYPTITEIVGDFVKFCQGYDLVGNNLDQLLELLNYYAVPVGFNFDNNLIVQSDLLSAMFDKTSITKKPNCFKLEEVCKSLKVAFKSESFCKESAFSVATCLTALAQRSK